MVESKKIIEKKISFCLFCILIFWGVSGFMLIGDYMTLPRRTDDPDFIYGIEFNNIYSMEKDYWVICVGDGKITNIENIIIWVFMLWGLLRGFDLIRFFMVNYKKE